MPRVCHSSKGFVFIAFHELCLASLDTLSVRFARHLIVVIRFTHNIRSSRKDFYESMAPSPITEDYYKILEVEQSATPQLIVSSYKRLALKLHPDRNPKHGATEAFQLVCSLPGVGL